MKTLSLIAVFLSVFFCCSLEIAWADAEDGHRQIRVGYDNTTLNLYVGGNFIKSWKVAVPKARPRTDIVYQLLDFEVNPCWIPTDETIKLRARQGILLRSYYPPGSPGNAMGACKYYLYLDGKPTFLRLHDTNRPDQIGLKVTLGCIRMRNKEIKELTALLLDSDNQYLFSGKQTKRIKLSEPVTISFF